MMPIPGTCRKAKAAPAIEATSIRPGKIDGLCPDSDFCPFGRRCPDVTRTVSTIFSVVANNVIADPHSISVDIRNLQSINPTNYISVIDRQNRLNI